MIKKEYQERYCINKFGEYYVPFLYATNGRPYLKQLDIMYNRARQAAITQEITEVIAGAKAQKNKI